MLYLLLGPVVIWRITHMIQEEAGPFAIFFRINAWLASNTHNGIGGFYDGWTCFKCLSVWLSVIYTVFLPTADTVIGYLTTVLFLSGSAIFINMLYIRLGGSQ